MIYYNKIINLAVLLAIVAVTLLAVRIINKNTSKDTEENDGNMYVSTDLAIFMSSPLNKKIDSQQHQFEVYYPSDWKYNKSILSDSIYEFTPNIEGVKIEIEAIEKSKVSEDVFDLRPLTKVDILNDSMPTNFYSFRGLRIKKFKKMISEEMTNKYDLPHNSEIVLLQVDGRDYFYTISAIYPKSERSDYFLSLFSMFCQSFFVKQ